MLGRILFIGALAFFTGACASEAPTDLGPTSGSATALAPRLSATDAVARTIAVSLNDERVRIALRNAWQESRLSTDHKLVLQAYLETSSGEALLSSASSHGGLSREEFDRIVRELPEMDFYLPIRRHRETWSGGDDVLVALTFDQDSDYVTAFNTMGDAILVEGKSAEAGTNLIVLHPAEPKFPVVVSERESSGDHQQLSIAAGTSFAIPLGSTYVEGPEVRSSSTSSGVYLRYFDTWRDDGWFGGDLEMEFRSSGYEGGIPFNSGSGFFIFPSVTCVRGTGVGNFPSQPPVQANLLISPGLTSTSLLGCGGSSQTKGYAIWAYEMDFGPGAEDDFGMRFTSPGSMPYGLVVGTSSIAYNFFYSFPGTTAGQKSLYLGLRLQ